MTLLSLLRGAILAAAAIVHAGGGFAQTPPPVGVPSKVVGVHFAAWETDLNIRNVTQDANVIYLFNLRPHAGEVGTWYWEWPGWPSRADVQFVRARGQKVILSLGGAGFPFKFNSRAKTQATLDAIRAQIDNNFGPVDGIELNTFEGEENGVRRAALSDPAEILWLIQQLRTQYGSGFALTIPPAPNYQEDLALATALANNGALTWAAPQFYDWVGFNEPGFISGRMRDWVAAIGQTRSVVGLSANYPNGPTLADSTREWDIIEAEFPNIRGAVAWNAQFNHRGGNQWTAAMKERVIGSSPPPPPATKVQAENGTLNGVSVKSDHPGYEGSGFVDDFVDDGDKVTVAFNNVTAGRYDVRIRYQAWGEQYNYISINNAPTQPDQFPATGSGWGIKTVSGVNLVGGTNTVTVNTYWGYIRLDSIEIVPSTSTMKVQAENGTLNGVSVKSDHPGYEGSGFVDDFIDSGDKATVAFANLAAGSYDVRIRYQAWSEQYNYVSINGAPTQPAQFPATGSNWGIKTVSAVSLGNGTNTVTVDTYYGYIRLDSIELVRR